MSQKELFHTDAYDALTEDVKAVGIKKMAALLKPDSDPEQAAKWLNNCLDRKRDQKPDPEHYPIIINEARKVGSFAYVAFLMKETYFEPPVPKVYDIEAQRIGLKLEKINTELQQTMAQLQNLGRELKK